MYWCINWYSLHLLLLIPSSMVLCLVGEDNVKSDWLVRHKSSPAYMGMSTKLLLYIDDITRISLSEGTKLVLYADDMLLYRKIDHPEDYVALQMDINSVNNWIKGNYLMFNASKCKYMLISRRRQHHCDPPYSCLTTSAWRELNALNTWEFFSIQNCHGQIRLYLFVPKLVSC